MGLWESVKSALGFGGGAAGGVEGDRDGMYLYVRCGRCGDVVRVRVNMANELQQEFSDNGGVSGYSLHKTVVDSKCFRPIELSMTFDGRRRELSREVEGGEVVTREAYDASRAGPEPRP